MRRISLRRPLRGYGGSPLHLVAMIASLVVAGYAAVQLLSVRPITVAVWFVGAAVAHDAVLFPLYAVLDRSAALALRRRSAPAGSWVNYVRVPAMLSGLLLLVWFPLILRLPPSYSSSTGVPVDPYLGHWLWVTLGLAAGSALTFALSSSRSHRRLTRQDTATPVLDSDPDPTSH